MFFAPGWGPIARSAPSPHITHAPPRSALVAQRAGVSLPATWAALKCALQAPGGLFCGSRRLPQAAQPRIALGVPAAGPTRSRAAAPFCHQGGAASCPQPMGMPSKAASDGARRLRARAKVRVNIVVRLALTRCAAEPFFNREGEVAELTSLILDDPSGLTLLLGPKNCGKSALLLQVEEELQAAAQGGRPRGLVPRLAAFKPPPPLLHIDCRGISVATPAELSEALKQKATDANIWPQVAEFLAAAAAGSVAVDVAGPPWLGAFKTTLSFLGKRSAPASPTPSLQAILAALTEYFAQCKAAGITPVLVIDEANELMTWREEDQVALRKLLSFFILVTKQQNLAHVVLATSDFFFTSWLAKQGVDLINVKVLGELPEGEAKRYFCGGGGWAGLVAQRQAPPLEAGTWAEVYAVCGGNVGLLKQCVTLAKLAGSSWGKALVELEDVGSQAVDNGFDPGGLDARGSPPAWSAEQYKAALRCVACAPHHAVPRSAMIEALNLGRGPRGAKAANAALRSLVEYSLLALRPPSAMARDLPQEVYAYGAKRDQVVTMRSPAHLRYVLKMERQWAEEGEGGGAAASV